ncbi:MAG: helix-turn-helix domain-containing protein [Saprospiraceae bacterium]
MNTTILPVDLKLESTDAIQVFNYTTREDIIKTKIELSKNTISFLKVGTKEVIGDDKTAQIDNQRFLVMKAGHCLMTEKISNSSNIYQSILLFFSDDEVKSFLTRHELYANKSISQKTFYAFDYDTFILQFVDSLVWILSLPKETQQQMLKTKFEEIMLYLVHQNGADFLNAIVQNTDDKTVRLTNIVTNNRLKKLSLEELAFLCNMSISTFKRAFSSQYHVSPMKWFTEQRLKHAATLLRANSSRPIDVYEAAGYENFSNFVQAFKKQFGQTPKQYQQHD